MSVSISSAMNQQTKVLHLSLTFLNILGVHPYKVQRKLQTTTFVLSHLTLLILVYLQFIYEPLSFKLISDTFESVFTIVHVLPKFLTFLFAKPAMTRLLAATKKFWFSSNHSEIDQSLNLLTLLLKSFLFFISLVIGTFAIRPIFNETLAISCYIPGFIPRPIFIAFNNAVFAMSAFAVGSFDMFICVMVVLVALQIKTLNNVILELKIGDVTSEEQKEECLRNLKKCVVHHNFLIDFLHKVNTVVSPALLVYFTMAPIALCFELYFLSKSSNLAEIAKSCVYIAGIIIELFFFFCLPATYLLTQSQKMVDTMYSTGWEKCYYLSVRKTIIIMMQRMQREIILTAGKMVKINLETCTNVFRMGFSFYTSLLIVDDKTKWD